MKASALLVIAIVLLVSGGCAKRPGLMMTSAPSAGGSWAIAQAPSTGGPAARQPGARPNGTVHLGAGRLAATQPANGSPAVRKPEAAPAASTPPRVSPEGFVDVPELRTVYFDFDKYEIRPDAARALRDNAAWLKSRGTHLVLIEGHADERGTFEYNLALGDRRAASVKAFLVRHGVKGDRIATISYGEGRPTCAGQSEECWSRNRRGQFRVKLR